VDVPGFFLSPPPCPGDSIDTLEGVIAIAEKLNAVVAAPEEQAAEIDRLNGQFTNICQTLQSLTEQEWGHTQVR
jgi:hypothetical protein